MAEEENFFAKQRRESAAQGEPEEENFFAKQRRELKENPDKSVEEPENPWWTKVKLGASGVPIAGNFVPKSDEMKKFEKENPWSAFGYKAAGGAAGTTAALLGGPYIAGAKGAEYIKDLGFAGRSLYNAIVGGTLGAGDAATREGATAGDVLMGGALGGTFGGLSPTISKLVLSPGTVGKGAPNALPHIDEYLGNGLDKLGDTIEKSGSKIPMLLGALLGHRAGGFEGSIAGALTGEAAKPVLRGLFKAYRNNKIMDNAIGNNVLTGAMVGGGTTQDLPRDSGIPIPSLWNQ